MNPEENIQELIRKSEVTTDTHTDKRILKDAMEHLEQIKSQKTPVSRLYIWRIIMKSNIIKFAAAVIILVAVIVGVNYTGTPIDGAGAAFAAAMDNVQKARAFTCIQIMGKDNQDIWKFMFKEPHLERYEHLTSLKPESVKQTTITDFGKHNELIIKTAEKTAVLYENNYFYEVDEKTGELKLIELDTSLRDQMLEWAMGAVDDLGNSELNGQTVRMLQSKNNKRLTTIWINPKTNYPVQIEHQWPGENRPKVLYTSIQIDTELNDSLFSLAPPEGYSYKVIDPGWSDYQRKIGSKTKYIVLQCIIYADRHNGRFPNKLEDIVPAGLITEEAFKKLVTAPDESNGQSMFRYQNLGTNAESSSNAVMLYEAYDQWPDEGIVAGFRDGHVEIIKRESDFLKLISQ
jgi:outer membrane lipoprotein-sorting protein